MSRPRSSRRQAFESWVQGRNRFTMADASQSLGWSISAVNEVMKRAQRGGEIRRRPESVRHAHCKRPVAVYEPVGRVSEPQAESIDLQSILRTWRG